MYSREFSMRRLDIVMVAAILLTAMTSGSGWAGYVCEYSNSEGSGNDATYNTVGIAILSEDNFVMSINAQFAPDSAYYAICKWTDATYSTGRGNDVRQWIYNFETIDLENPLGLASDGYGNVYVANNDPGHNILVFNVNGPDPVATPFRIEIHTDDTLSAIDVDNWGHVYVCYSDADLDRVEVYPSILDEIWVYHEGVVLSAVYLPDGLYYGMCVNEDGTEIYVSEYTSSNIHRYTGSPSTGYALDGDFSLHVDSLATALDMDDQGYLYVISDHWREKTYEYSWFWVVDLDSEVVTDKIDMYWEGGGDIHGASETSAGYYSAVDIELDDAGDLYVVHDYAWAMEKWVGSPSTGVEIIPGSPRLPRESILVQNYPNPFNASTEIHYRLPEDAHVRLDLFNVAGQLVEHLVDGEQTAGQHVVDWNAGNLPSGIYLARLYAGDQMATRKMVLVR
jgi:hypothetical protein